LGAVQAQAELALGEFEAGSSCSAELKAIRELTMRGSEIVRQLMIYAGKESEVAGLVDLSKIVDEMLSLLKVSVTKHAVIKANLDQNLPAVAGSAAQIRQIVMNLIINASDAIGDRDGVIGVTTKRVTLNGESAEISTKPLPDGEYVHLDVSDSGCGIPAQVQGNVFDPFFSTKSAGRGLGLAVVQGIVWRLGGTIHFVSSLGKGTTFQVLLPCAETATVASSDGMCAAGELAEPTKDGTLLVVEDESYLRQAVVKMLRKNGFEVFDAADGTAAINLLRADRRKIDMILLDMTLPGATSYEVVCEAASARPDIKVILTSAYSEEIVSGTMNAPQIRGFVRKPFQLQELVKTLRSALSA
jgi:CheY-like chemotaxis protein